MTDQNSQFMAILTNIGKAKQANADALGIPWKFAQMGVGDANGNEPIPSEHQTHLINERRRAPLNQVKVDSANLNIIIAEQVIPENVGGWWVREIGLYDADGDLVAVANCAPSFKPLLIQGSGRTQVVRINLIVSNTLNVELKIDPSVVLATRQYVDLQIAEELDRSGSKQQATFQKQIDNFAPVDSPVLRGTPTAPTVAGTDNSSKIATSAAVRAIIGEFGIGAVAVSYIDNIDGLVLNGIYSVSTATTGTKPSMPGDSVKIPNGTILHMERGSSSMATQIWDSLISERNSLIFLRTRTSAGTWTAWVQLLTGDNVATQVQVEAGMADRAIVTPKTMRRGVMYSLGVNGYLFLPSWLGGIGIQWGSGMTNPTGTTHSYPMAFPNAVFQLIGSDRGATSIESISVELASTEQYKARASAGNIGFAFFALGR